MDVTCPACAARYTADEQKLRGKTARMRCRACDTVWLVAGPEGSNEAAAYAARGSAEGASDMNGMTDSKRAAIRRRGDEREHRDLFASRPLDLGSVKQTLRPGPTETTNVAARNENSVLFTVDALPGAARVKTPAPAASPLPNDLQMNEPKMIEDDEGIIDLNALASVPPKAGARHIAAPLFSEPPPAAFAADVNGTGSSAAFPSSGGFELAGIRFGKRAIAGIAAAAVAVVLGGIGVAAAFRGEEPVARTQATMIAPSVATPPAPAPAAPAAETKPADPAPAATTASNDDEDDKAPAGKKGKKGKRGGKAGMSGGHANMSKVKSSGTEGLASTKPAAASKPAGDKCGCKGDFNCILRCTAKGK